MVTRRICVLLALSALLALQLLAQDRTPETRQQARDHVLRGIQLHDEKKHHEALQEYNKAIELAPDWWLPFYERGYTYYDMREHLLAEESLRRGIELNPECWQCLEVLGNLYDNTDRPDEALAIYQKALDIAPDEPRLLLNFGITLRRLNRFDESEQAFLKAQRIKPDYASPWFQLARLYAQQDKLYLAQEQLEQFSVLEPNTQRTEEARRLLRIHVSVDESLRRDGKPIPEAQPYVVYGLRRAQWVQRHHRALSPDAATYQPCYFEEKDALEEQAKAAREEKEKGNHTLDPDLLRLLLIYDAGYLDAFIFSYAGDLFPGDFADWLRQYPGRLEAFHAWARDNALSTDPVRQRVTLFWFGKELPGKR